ncbi:uncharacterized protein HKW66_Vig0238050 [Vigna angularis]|uniref:Uncharacterized protein n=1 Tax=Phaseolus angularis TaxID=3914 RepID=A0A8T0KUD7_PHAAN|nr:uncharacterized protein HKW66_Vig0238050 [Vigna angularis]
MLLDADASTLSPFSPLFDKHQKGMREKTSQPNSDGDDVREEGGGNEMTMTVRRFGRGLHWFGMLKDWGI